MSTVREKIITGITETVDKYFPNRKKIKKIESVELTPDPEDLPNVSNVQMGRGGRNSHIVYKKR